MQKKKQTMICRFFLEFDSMNIRNMEQIFLADDLPKETFRAMTLCRDTKVKVYSPDGDRDFFDIVAGVLQGDSFAKYLFIICLD